MSGRDPSNTCLNKLLRVVDGANRHGGLLHSRSLKVMISP